LGCDGALGRLDAIHRSLLQSCSFGILRVDE
jgi:hypothetical protein